MRKLPGNLVIVIVATALVALAPAAAQDAPYTAPRLVGTENPDLNGIWRLSTRRIGTSGPMLRHLPPSR